MNDYAQPETAFPVIPSKGYWLPPLGEAHDGTCCMNGVPADAGPHPQCPGAAAVLFAGGAA